MEGDAGPRQLNPTETDADEPEESAAVLETENDELSPNEDSSDVAEPQDTAESSSDDGESHDGRRQERFGRGWFVAIVAALIVGALAIGAGGYVALRAQAAGKAMDRNDALALERAKECVSATQAPDIAAMTASQSKIIECSTGDFAVQATLFSSVLVEAYQSANVAVQVSELRGAVERHNDDGSIDVLIAVRVKVTNSQVANQDQGYRLRVQMAPADGTYKIARLDQVTS